MYFYFIEISTMRRLQFVISFVFLFVGVVAQENRVDSLLNQFGKDQPDSSRLDLYVEIGNYYGLDRPDSALFYYYKGLDFSKKHSYELGKARCFFRISKILTYRGHYQSAIDTFKSALRIYDMEGQTKEIASILNNIGVNYYNLSAFDSCRFYWSKTKQLYTQIEDSLGLATSYANLGAVDYVQSDYEGALQYFIKALEIRERMGSDRSLASIYMKIALIYGKLEDYEKSYDYLKQAVKLYDTQGDLLGKAKAMINLSNAYVRLDSLGQSKRVLRNAEKLIHNIDNKRVLSTVNINLGNTYLREDNLDSALVHFYIALDLIRELGQKRELSSLYVTIGEVFMQLEDYKASIEYFKSSLSIMDEIKVSVDKVETLRLLSESYAYLNDYKLAYAYHQSYALQKDSVAKLEKNVNLERLEAKFEKRQQEQRIKLLENQQRLNELDLHRIQTSRNFLVITAILIFLLLLLVFLRYRQKVALNKVLKDKNREVQQKNKEIKIQSSNLEEFNRLLVGKNSLIEKQKLEMERANQTKDRFFSIIGHDLRSPIAAVYSIIGLLRLKEYDRDKQIYFINSIESNLQTTLELLENLMLWAKNQDKILKPNFQIVNLNEVVLRAVKSIEAMVRMKQVNVEFAPVDDFMVDIDVNMMATVIRNLLSNAIKFSHVEGTVCINIFRQSDTIKVQVKDEGVGMSNDVIQKVMTKNSSFTREGTKSERGSGLGLNLCRDFIEMHGGVLMVESEMGKGSTLSFSIPISKKTQIK